MHCIVGLAGKKRVGKDTCADFLVASHGFVKLSFADPLKETCKLLFRFSDDQLWDRAGAESQKEVVDPRYDKTPRHILQWLGTDCIRRYIGHDFWVRRLTAQIDELPAYTKVVIADVRFQNEVDAILARGGTIIEISREISSKSCFSDRHISETTELNGTAALVNDGDIASLCDKLEDVLRSQAPRSLVQLI